MNENIKKSGSSAESKNELWYRFFQPYGTLDLLIEPWVGLAEYVERLKPVRIQRIRRENARGCSWGAV